MTLPSTFPNYTPQPRVHEEAIRPLPIRRPSVAPAHFTKPLEQSAAEQLSLALSILHEQWRVSAQGSEPQPNKKTPGKWHRLAGRTPSFKAKYAIKASERELTRQEASRIRKLRRDAKAQRQWKQLDQSLNRLLSSPSVGRLKAAICALMLASVAGVAIYPGISESPLIAHLKKQAPSVSSHGETIVSIVPPQAEVGSYVASSPLKTEIAPITLDFTPKR